MKIVRLAAAAVGLALLLGVSGCGTDNEDEAAVSSEFRGYCAEAKTNQSIFADDGTGVSLINNLDKVRQIADAAPDDLQDEWQVFLGALEGLRNAIEAAGLKPSDFVDGKPPASTSVTDRQAIAVAADRLGQQDVLEAASGIEQHAKDVCKFQLGL